MLIFAAFFLFASFSQVPPCGERVPAGVRLRQRCVAPAASLPLPVPIMTWNRCSLAQAPFVCWTSLRQAWSLTTGYDKLPSHCLLMFRHCHTQQHEGRVVDVLFSHDGNVSLPPFRVAPSCSEERSDALSRRFSSRCSFCIRWATTATSACTTSSGTTPPSASSALPSPSPRTLSPSEGRHRSQRRSRKVV